MSSLPERFWTIWIQKEASSKLLGVGLTAMFSISDVWEVNCVSSRLPLSLNHCAYVSHVKTKVMPADTARADGELYMINEAWLRPAYLPGEDHVGIH